MRVRAVSRVCACAVVALSAISAFLPFVLLVFIYIEPKKPKKWVLGFGFCVLLANGYWLLGACACVLLFPFLLILNSRAELDKKLALLLPNYSACIGLRIPRAYVHLNREGEGECLIYTEIEIGRKLAPRRGAGAALECAWGLWS